MHSGGCSTTMSGFRSSPSLRYAYWRLPNHYVRVHHLSCMHIGGCSTTMLGFTISQVCTLEVAQPLCQGSPSLGYAQWRVHHLSGMHSGGFTISYVRTLQVAQPLCGGSWFTISQVCTLEVAQPLCWGSWFTISQVCTLEVAQPLCWGSWFTISQVCTLEVAQPLCWDARAHHLSGTHTGGWQTGTCFFLTPCGQPWPKPLALRNVFVTKQAQT